MKLILDANLSWRLIERLKPYFEDCFHVDHVGLITPATDISIWNYALKNNLVIITNDEDFINLINMKGFPPKIVLLKTGNQSNNYIFELLIKHIQVINDFQLSGDIGLLEIF